MRNKYEFKIEEISTVKVTDKSSNYSTTYFRIEKDSKLTRDFIVFYGAPPEELDDKISVICPRCERWNTFDPDEYKSKDFKYKCKYCDDDYKEIIGETSLIDVIQSYLTEDLYFDVDLMINDIKIV